VNDLSTLANLAEIFGAAVVVVGLGFGVIQIQHYRQQRRETAAFELLRSFQNAEFSRSLRAVLELASGIRNELLGGVCVESWKRLKNYTEESRAERDRNTMSEWFQWLAERLEEHHEREGREAAYEEHRHWRS
jgi:hypothetical protein